MINELITTRWRARTRAPAIQRINERTSVVTVISAITIGGQTGVNVLPVRARL